MIFFTAEDGTVQTINGQRCDAAKKIYEDCFLPTMLRRWTFSSYTIMSRKDEGYNWEHSDMGLTPEANGYGQQKASVTMNMEVHVSLRYPEDTELTGNGYLCDPQKRGREFWLYFERPGIYLKRLIAQKGMAFHSLFYISFNIGKSREIRLSSAFGNNRIFL